MKHILLFVGEIPNHTRELFNFMKQKGYMCIESSNVDEIDQVGKQIGKAFLIFSDPKFSFRYLSENKWDDVILYNVLYVAKTPIITPDVQKKIDSVKLNIFHPKSLNNLVEQIDNFYSNKKSISVDTEIEFSVHQELEKKA